MSLKHFNEYYKDLQKNYNDMLNGLHELEKACSSGMVEPERVDEFMKTMQPIKDSFLAVQYIKYLIDKPNKKSKQNRYENQTKEVFKNKFKQVPEDNKKLVEKIRNLV